MCTQSKLHIRDLIDCGLRYHQVVVADVSRATYVPIEREKQKFGPPSVIDYTLFLCISNAAFLFFSIGMAGRVGGRPVRSAGSTIPKKATLTHGKSKAKPQSKKRAAYRSQNAFNLAGDDAEASEPLLDDEAGVVKSEDDEEIDSDEAFESGDEDKYSSFKFAASRKNQAPQKREKVKIPTVSHKKAPSKRQEIDLNEDSDMDGKTIHAKSEYRSSKELPITNDDDSSSESGSYGSEVSASDFEDDDGADLMDLSEMLGPSRSKSGVQQKKEATKGPVGDMGLSMIDEIPYEEFAEESDEMDKGRDATLHEDSIPQSGMNELSSDDSDMSSAESSDENEDSGSELGDEVLEQILGSLDQKRKREDENNASLGTKVKRNKPVEDEANERTAESEYNLNPVSTAAKLRLEDMLESLNPKAAKSMRKAQPLSAPLAKPIQDRVDRMAAYDTTKEQISKWQPAVKQLREASVLKFPLNEPSKGQATNNSLASSFKPTNELEVEIDTILKESGMQSEKQIAAFEDLEMAKLSVEEVQKRRADLAIMRDLMFRQERKAKRQNKIKSKAYRRVHRKEREKLAAALQEAEGDEEEQNQKLEERRARERMELRHKNTGKWAQKMISRADHGEGSRAAITEQLQRGEELERKIRGLGRATGASDSDDDSDQSQGEGDTIEDNPLPKKGVFSMKFMRDADAREAAEIAELDQVEADDDSGSALANSNGRRTFTPANATKHKVQDDKQLIENKSQISSAQTEADQGLQILTRDQKPVSQHDSHTEEDNPWLSKGVRAHRADKTIIARDTDDSLKFASKLAKAKRVNVPKHSGNINGAKLNNAKILSLKPVDSTEVNGADEDVEFETLTYAKGRPALKQADLVAKAFAGDDVVAEFANTKEATEKEDAPQEIDETLPGWGSWTGDGVKKRKNAKKFTRHVEGITSEKRKDAKLQHVIINEKRMKQAKPYLSQAVPFPFENKEQYERSLNLPIGPEWTTRTNFQKQIMPHVIKKQGQVIAPMERPFRD